jgi:hypothetical protein
MKQPNDTDLISQNSNCTLYKTLQTSISSDTTTLQYVCSEYLGKTYFHRKLKLYRRARGYYVIAHGTRCSVTDLANKWFYK